MMPEDTDVPGLQTPLLKLEGLSGQSGMRVCHTVVHHYKGCIICLRAVYDPPKGA